MKLMILELKDIYLLAIDGLKKLKVTYKDNDDDDNVDLIDPILKDRITIIDTHPLTLPEKITISKNFVIPEILKEIGFGSDELVFSDDIEWCKENLSKLNVNIHFIEGNENIIDLFTMSMCDNNICSASSFSWWGAYLNKKRNRVIFPKVWFGPKYRDLHDTKDLLLPEWETI